MKKINNVYIYFICIIELVFMFLLYLVNEKLNIYSNLSYFTLSILFLTILLVFVIKKYSFGIVIGLMFIVNALFFRNKVELDSYFNFKIYLDYWFKHISNEVVFYNILGNVCVFIPLAIFMYFDSRKYFDTLKSILYVIILFEFSQAFLKLGVFDIVDIVLNYFGVVIIITGVYLWDLKVLMKNN